MRTTLSIDDDVLAAAKGLAERQRKSVGEVISALARSGLHPVADRSARRNGVPLLQRTSGKRHMAPVTPEIVRQLLDELP